MRHNILRWTILMLVVVAMPLAQAFAEEVTSETVSSADMTLGAAPSEKALPEEDMKLELATKMHKIQSSAEQVNNAIDVVAQNIPVKEREVFVNAMRRVLNYRAIEKISIDAMASTFTVDELKAMLEYNQKPEAQSIADKYPSYQNKVSPEIVRMLDKAMMRVRTGGMQ